MFPHLVLLLNMLGGWMNRHQQMAIDYLMEENKVLKELHGDKRLNFTNEQRKRLAADFRIRTGFCGQSRTSKPTLRNEEEGHPV